MLRGPRAHHPPPAARAARAPAGGAAPSSTCATSTARLNFEAREDEEEADDAAKEDEELERTAQVLLRLRTYNRVPINKLLLFQKGQEAARHRSAASLHSAGAAVASAVRASHAFRNC